MSLLFRAPAPTKRDAFPYPDIPPNSRAGREYGSALGGSAEGALQKVAVFAAVNLIAGVSSMLPIDGYLGTGQNKREVALPVFFTDPDGTGQGLADWLYQAYLSTLLRGNVFGRVLSRDALGRPTQVQLLHPDLVSLREVEGRPVWRYKNQVIPTADMWHRRAFPVPGCRLGLSPIALHAMTISEGLEAARFGLQFFQQGAHPSAILTNKDAREISQADARTVKDRFLAAVGLNREPVVLSGGWEYTAIQVSPEESQFLATQAYSSAECARIFGPGMPEILGYETGDSMTYKNVEQRSVDLLKFSLNRWLVWAEQFLSTDFLPRPRYVRFNRAALLATDTLTRFKAHEIALRNQFETVNEVRDLEDMPPVDWGDTPNEPSAPAPTAAQTQEQ